MEPGRRDGSRPCKHHLPSPRLLCFHHAGCFHQLQFEESFLLNRARWTSLPDVRPIPHFSGQSFPPIAFAPPEQTGAAPGRFWRWAGPAIRGVWPGSPRILSDGHRTGYGQDTDRLRTGWGGRGGKKRERRSGKKGKRAAEQEKDAVGARSRSLFSCQNSGRDVDYGTLRICPQRLASLNKEQAGGRPKPARGETRNGGPGSRRMTT